MNVSTLSPEDCRALVSKLTEGQLAALRLMCVHGNSKAVAEELQTSPNAINSRLHHVYDAIGVRNGFAAAVIATKAGVV